MNEQALQLVIEGSLIVSELAGLAAEIARDLEFLGQDTTNAREGVFAGLHRRLLDIIRKGDELLLKL